jgi:hypothetical protein
MQKIISMLAAVVVMSGVSLGYANTILIPLEGNAAVTSPITSAAVNFGFSDGEITQCLVTIVETVNNTGLIECKVLGSDLNPLNPLRSATWMCSSVAGTNQGPCNGTAGTPVTLPIAFGTPLDPQTVTIEGVRIVALGPQVTPTGPIPSTAVNYEIDLNPSSADFNKVTACLVKFDDALIADTIIECELRNASLAVVTEGSIQLGSNVAAFTEIRIPVNATSLLEDIDDVHVIVQPPTEACNGLAPTIIGTAGNDIIMGTGGADIIVGLGGNDTIDGAAGNDVICGGEGDDNILGGEGSDVIFGGEGNDTVNGENATDIVCGGAGNDTLNGGNSGDDQLSGESGDDNLSGDNGKDTLYGGKGVDTIDGGLADDTAVGGDGVDTIINSEVVTQDGANVAPF